MPTPYLITRVRGRLCALPLGQVGETLRTPAVLGNRGDIPALMGIAVYRGTKAALLDLGEMLGYTGAGGARTRAVAVTVTPGAWTLFAVDEVLGVRTLNEGQVMAMELPGGSRRMGQFDDGFVRLIEAGGLLPEDTWAALGEASHGEAAA